MPSGRDVLRPKGKCGQGESSLEKVAVRADPRQLERCGRGGGQNAPRRSSFLFIRRGAKFRNRIEIYDEEDVVLSPVMLMDAEFQNVST